MVAGIFLIPNLLTGIVFQYFKSYIWTAYVYAMDKSMWDYTFI